MPLLSCSWAAQRATSCLAPAPPCFLQCMQPSAAGASQQLRAQGSVHSGPPSVLRSKKAAAAQRASHGTITNGTDGRSRPSARSAALATAHRPSGLSAS
eukprot:scaffold14330_cov63-Phaeocystis_antarctica.AAC.1